MCDATQVALARRSDQLHVTEKRSPDHDNFAVHLGEVESQVEVEGVVASRSHQTGPIVERASQVANELLARNRVLALRPWMVTPFAG